MTHSPVDQEVVVTGSPFQSHKIRAEMDAYDKLVQDYLGKPIREITEREWEHQLNQLPPLNWTRGEHGLEMFMCCEPMIAEVHSQYVRCGIRFFHKYAHRTKRSTWFTIAEIDAVRDTAPKSAELIVESIMNDASGSWKTDYIETKAEAIILALMEAGYTKNG